MFKFDEVLRAPVDADKGWSFVRVGGAYGQRRSQFFARGTNGDSKPISKVFSWEDRTVKVGDDQRKQLPSHVECITIRKVTAASDEMGLLLPETNAGETVDILMQALGCLFEAQSDYAGKHGEYRIAGKEALVVEVADSLLTRLEQAQ